MNVLVVDNNGLERDSLARLLQQGGLRVEAVADLARATAAVDHEMPDVIVLDWSLGAPQFVQQLRRSSALTRPYVVALLGTQPPAVIPALLTAGADDFVRRPIVREELIARVEAPKRLRHLAQSAPTVDEQPRADLLRLRTVQQLGAIVMADVEQMLGQPMHVAEGWCGQLSGVCLARTVPLSLATQGIELRLSIVADAPSLRAMAEVLLGDPTADEATFDDMLGEVANIAAGAVKRAGLDESVNFTIGLPITGLPEPRDDATMRRWVISGAKLLHMGVVAGVFQRENHRVAAMKLREGMIVVRDLRNEAGGLLLPAGTRLTSTAAARISQILGERFLVEVSCAA